MKKTKLLVPLLGITATAGAIVPLAVSCNKKAATYTVKAVDCEGIETITDKEVDNEGEYSVEVKPLANYTLDGTITVKVGDKDAEASYYNYVPANSGSYKLTIAKVTGNTTFTIKGVADKVIGSIKAGFINEAKPADDIVLEPSVNTITEKMKVGDSVTFTTKSTGETKVSQYTVYVPLDTTLEQEDLIDSRVVNIKPATGKLIHLISGVDYTFELATYNSVTFKVLSVSKFVEAAKAGQFSLEINLAAMEVSEIALKPILENEAISESDITVSYSIGGAAYKTYSAPIAEEEVDELINGKKIDIKLHTEAPKYLLPYTVLTLPVVETNNLYLISGVDFTFERDSATKDLIYHFASGSVLDDIYIRVWGYNS